jgi:hypothetical protein
VGVAYQAVLAKYDWAKEHIDKLEAAIHGFREANKHALGRKPDDQTGEFVFYVAHVPVIPDRLRLMLGDAIHNLRSTLDHLACALVSRADPANDCSYTSFPIFDTPESYEATARSKVPGLGKHAYETFERIQPYRDGAGHNLWKLHKLDIVDKHRLLLSVATIPVMNSTMPSIKSQIDSAQGVLGDVGVFFGQMLFADASPKYIPMEAGRELGRVHASELYNNVPFAFEIAINEPEILVGLPIFLFLRTVSNEVSMIIRSFASFL